MFDYHNHSNFSDDGVVSMEDMVEAGYKAGLSEIAITDHFDPDYPDLNFPFTLEFDDYHKELERVQAQFKGKIKVIKGIEIGIQHGKTLEACRAAAKAYPYDFIIGSFHCSGGCDLFSPNYFAGKSPEEAYIDFYEYTYNCLKEYKDYDVVGHINIIDRYTPSIPPNNVYMDIVEEILKLIINDGKGLEINTSSFRYGLGQRTTPAIEILQLFKDLGGEIVTTGSDAHATKDTNYKLDYALHMLKKVGLNYVTTFEKRKPTFNKINI